MLNSDKWDRLWKLATDDSEGVVIVPHLHDPNIVRLQFPDGNVLGLEWLGQRWELMGTLDTCPCDVAARDSL